MGHIVDLLLFVSAFILTAIWPARSLLPAISGLFLALIIGDFVLDTMSLQAFDTLVSFLWVVPGLVMAWSPSTSRCAYARRFFFAGACLQVPHAVADVFYGTALNTESAVYHWLDSNGDLLIRSVYLLALIDMMLSARPMSTAQFTVLGDRAGGYDDGNRLKSERSVQTPYQRYLYLLSTYKFTWPARMVGIVSSSVELAHWKIKHPDSTFADYYAGRISRYLDRGGGHPTLGRRQLFPPRPLEPSALISMDDQRQRGREDFAFLLGLGLKPEHICVDFGCGSLRIGQHLIEHLDAGHYWGLDVTDRFYRDGLALLPPGQVEAKQPNLDVICDESLRLIAQVSPDFIISFSVLSHVPPFRKFCIPASNSSPSTERARSRNSWGRDFRFGRVIRMLISSP
jgi:hypothetical protein